MTDLLACPFCGHDPIIAVLADGTSVQCDGCGNGTCVFTEEKGAIAAWNTRAPVGEAMTKAIRILDDMLRDGDLNMADAARLGVARAAIAAMRAP